MIYDIYEERERVIQTRLKGRERESWRCSFCCCERKRERIEVTGEENGMLFVLFILHSAID